MAALQAAAASGDPKRLAAAVMQAAAAHAAADDAANGAANGAANRAANGAANRAANGAANRAANGAANRAANRAANGAANGAANRGSMPAAHEAAGDTDDAVEQAAAAMAGMGAIDPLAVTVPPELGGPIYGWIRRLALQADLQGADKVLREAFTDLTSSLSVAIVYPGADGLWTLGNDDEIPKQAAPLVAVAQARRAMVASHTALIPVVTSTETVAVVVLTRNPRNPGYHPAEQVAAVALAREAAAILHHLAVAHLTKAAEIKADQGGLYRGEALEAHRARGNEGVPVNLSPSWVKRAYPLLVVTIVLAIVLAIVVSVPTYSSGMGVVILPGTPITAAGGSIEEVLVQPGQRVEKGQALVKLSSITEQAELQNARADADNLTTMFLYDLLDEQVKKQLGQALNRVKREQERVEQRIVRAKVSGTVSDIRVRQGTAVNAGDVVLQIVDPSTEPEVWAFLPAKDRPRLRAGQVLQTELGGYTKTREKAIIFAVSPEATGANDAAKYIGPQLADAMKLAQGGTYVVVKAKLPGKTFKTQHSTLYFHHGMTAKTEVKIKDKPFIVTLLPSLEKYIPD